MKIPIRTKVILQCKHLWQKLCLTPPPPPPFFPTSVKFLRSSSENTKLHTFFFSWLDLTSYFSRYLQLDFWTYIELPFLIQYLSLPGFHKQDGKSPSSRCSHSTFIHHKTQISARHYVNLILLIVNGKKKNLSEKLFWKLGKKCQRIPKAVQNKPSYKIHKTELVSAYTQVIHLNILFLKFWAIKPVCKTSVLQTILFLAIEFRQT